MPERPVGRTDAMQTKQFVMISKAFSDGVSLQKDGPLLTREYSNECILDAGRSYRTEASFIPKLVAKHFITTLTVDEELTYYECIAFERRTVMKKFSETTNIFPKDKVSRYCSHLVFDPDTTTRRYIAGIELLPAQKYVVTGEELEDEVSDATDCTGKNTMNGDIDDCQLLNGEM